MKIRFLYTLLITILMGSTISAQITRRFPTTTTPATTQPAAQNNNTIPVQPAVPATANETTTIVPEKYDQFEIAGIAGTIFTVLDYYDGSPASYKHAQQISINLVPIISGNSYAFRLVFYSSSENIAQASFYDQNVLKIWYPMTMYNDIKEKLDQNLNDKKKIFVTVIKRSDGYREGSIYFTTF